MLLLKIYDKSYTNLTTLSSSDFSEERYKRTLDSVGDCEFVVRLDSSKVTETNLGLYNRVEIEDSGEVKFVGLIINLQVKLNVATIRCRELTYILNKRIMGADYVVNGITGTEITDLLSDVNTAEDTGISIGDVSGAVGSIDTTFNRASAFEILRQVTKATVNQFILQGDRTLDIAETVGTDKSTSVIFRYDTDIISAANILEFRVEDEGDEIATKAYGKSGSNTSVQEDTSLQTKYGLLETYKDFRVVNTASVLDDFTTAELRDRIYAPDIRLTPDVEDNFDIGDTVRVILNNSLITIDQSFQVIEKVVKYKGNQRQISVRINDLSLDLANILNDRERRLELLEKEL